jgi:hypothetical protein
METITFSNTSTAGLLMNTLIADAALNGLRTWSTVVIPLDLRFTLPLLISLSLGLRGNTLIPNLSLFSQLTFEDEVITRCFPSAGLTPATANLPTWLMVLVSGTYWKVGSRASSMTVAWLTFSVVVFANMLVTGATAWSFGSCKLLIASGSFGVARFTYKVLMGWQPCNGTVLLNNVKTYSGQILQLFSMTTYIFWVSISRQ